MQVDVINGQLTEHFNIREFCDYFEDCKLYIDYDFIKFVTILERFRSWYKRPINISSCYRSKACNDYYKGSKNSAHLRSCAVDFPLPVEFFTFTKERKAEFLNNVKIKWIAICDDCGFYPQVNFYDDRLHLGISRVHASFIDERSVENV